MSCGSPQSRTLDQHLYESLEDSENLPDPESLAAEIVENLEAALEQFKSIYEEFADKETVYGQSRI
jgi:hypothetical protein